MKFKLATIALVAVAVAAPTSQTPDSFSIKNVVSAGSGCPQGSIDINWSESGILPIYFNKQFTARVGADQTADESRKNCQINMALQFSPGFSFAVFSADYSGWGDLDAGVTGVVKSTYYFSASQDQTSSALSISGPFHGRYYKQDDVAAAVWSPCGGDAMLNINSEVALTPLATPASGVLASTKEAGRFTSNVHVQWRKC
ncbi:hypothetical protein GMOD_00001361 [Pyrenophora seminiperda CCB06]|uniref:Secreted n=1 Tax=Pyrenophora seminiperda CCB06 TaxID=1302712 RepID=A0A3M7LYX4_9PLEO|nr:hypothetical protein GMOD_00001361 [Pyrenophora seminiperda CCB06]